MSIERYLAGYDLEPTRHKVVSGIAEDIFARNPDCELAKDLAIDHMFGIPLREASIHELLESLRIEFWAILLPRQSNSKTCLYFHYQTSWDAPRILEGI